MKILVFDIGGTYIKYSLIDTNLLKEFDIKVEKIETRIKDNKNYILEDIKKVIYENIKEDIEMIGIATAGVVDNKEGKIIYAGPTIPGYIGCEIKKEIEKEFNIKCIVENDVNAACLGEYRYSKLNGITFMLTIGTGIGGSIINENKIFYGNSNFAGEIGYLPIENKKLQELSSTSSLIKNVSIKLNKEVDGKYIFEEAKKGNKICLVEIKKMINNLVKGILSIIYILNPKNIIIGGAISNQGKYLEDMILEEIKEQIIDTKFIPNIEIAKLKNRAGLYGMLELCKEEYKLKNDFYIF